MCNNPPVDISVEEKIVHENYEPKSRDQHNDIALLRLSKDVQYTNFIKPICLPVDDSIKTKDLNGVTLDVAGWGLIKLRPSFECNIIKLSFLGKTETSSTSTRKLKVAINAYSNSDCKGVYGPLSIVITDTQVIIVFFFIFLFNNDLNKSLNFLTDLCWWRSRKRFMVSFIIKLF